MATREGGNLRCFNGAIFNNYKYSINSRTLNVIYYVCSHYQRGTCRARGVFKNNEFTLLTRHSHGPEVRRVTEEAMKRDLYRHVTRSTVHYRRIYDTVRSEHLNASTSLTFSRVENSMYKWRQSCCPPNVSTLHSFATTINRHQWENFLNYKYGRMTISYVTGDDSSESVVILDPNFVRKIATNGFFFLDATFKVTPTLVDAQQLLTIMSKKFNKAFPIIWVLMTRKTAEAYSAVFQEIKRLIPEFQMQEAMADYETALKNALIQEFPGIIVYGCFFHYCQALYRNAKRLGLRNYLRQNATIRRLLALLMSLPLLPADVIENTYRQICTSLDAETRRIVQQFLTYFENEWLARITPRGFSVYMLVDRTNNFLEGYHTTLKEKLGIHSAIWNFTKDLIKFQESLQCELNSLERGYPVGRLPRVANLQNQRLLLHAWSVLNEPHGFTPMQFLDHVLSYKLNITEAYFLLYSPPN